MLNHLIEITRYRDRRLMGEALVAALLQAVDADGVFLFDLAIAHGQSWLRIKASKTRSDAAGCRSLADDPQPLAAYPVLATCIAQGARSAQEAGPDGTIRTWLPIWRGERPERVADGSVCLVHRQPLAAAVRDDLLALFAVCENFLALLDYSEKDSLTGLLNRKTFDQQFGELIVGSLGPQPAYDLGQPERRQADAPIHHWIGVIDIDHFKQVNDRYGHLYGDEVLILLANILKSSFREQDRVFRFGGEEFVVLLRATTLENARRSFERLRETVAQHAFPQIGRITISVGFVSIGQQTPVTILGQADQALYFAKEHGRNQVCFYDELVSSGKLEAVAVNSDVDFF